MRGVGGGRGVEGGRAWGFLVNWGGGGIGEIFFILQFGKFEEGLNI